MVNKKELIVGVVLTVFILGLVVAGWLSWGNALGLVGVAVLAWFFRKEELGRWVRTGLFLVLVPLTFWTATFKPEGFSYPLLMGLPGENDDVHRFELFINFSKALAGFILLYLLWPKLREGEFIARARYQFGVALLAPMIIVGIAIPMLGLYLQPKQLEQMLLFAAANLLVICVAEEAFMRFLFQQHLRNAVAGFTVNHWLQELVPLILVTGIFVAIHSGLNSATIWVYMLAGFLYGLSYTLSKNICYPIMIHFFVNQMHFSFLTYPLPLLG